MPYINTDDFELLKGPGAGKYRNEWAGAKLPDNIQKDTSTGFHPFNGFPVCYWSKSWQDYYVYVLVKLMKEYGFDGYYCDNTATKACINPEHPESHKSYIDEEGKSWQREPVFMARELYKRIYKAVKKANPDSIFYVNGGKPPFSFFEFSITSEYLYKFTGEELWAAFAKPDSMKGCFFSGRQIGSMKLGYPSTAGKNIKLATRNAISILLMGDTIACWEISCDTNEMLNFDKVKGDFKIWDAEWIPYWKNGEYLNCDKTGIYLTLYKKADSALIFLSNPEGEKDEDVTVNVTHEGIFRDLKNLSAKDAETGKPVELKKAMVLNIVVYSFTVKVSAHDYRAIVIENK